MRRLPGIGGVTLDLASKTLSVEYDPARTAVEQIQDAVAGVGYSSTVV